MIKGSGTYRTNLKVFAILSFPNGIEIYWIKKPTIFYPMRIAGHCWVRFTTPTMATSGHTATMYTRITFVHMIALIIHIYDHFLLRRGWLCQTSPALGISPHRVGLLVPAHKQTLHVEAAAISFRLNCYRRGG